MPIEDRFKQSIISTLAQRAANRCSNPDCEAITTGPSADPRDSVNVGEAAHIFGANPGAARYDENMTSSDRSSISNAIWLCGNCHKLVDDDPIRYPAGLLFEWQREHERRIAEQVGKASAEIRKRYEDRHLEEFGRLSYLAERLILEKSDIWEQRLTAEVMRFEMTPILQRWAALKRGLYMKPSIRVRSDEFFPWMSHRIEEIRLILAAFKELTNVEIVRSWGPPGVAGNEADIVTTCRLFAEMCQSSLAWEESVRFVTFDDIFNELHDLMVGRAGQILEEAAKVPAFLTEVASGNSKGGQFKLELTLSLPDGWNEAINEAMNRAVRAMRE